jgi:hypothetical protein
MDDPKDEIGFDGMEFRWGNHVKAQRKNGAVAEVVASLAAFHNVMDEERVMYDMIGEKYAPKVNITRGAAGMEFTDIPQDDHEREMDTYYKSKQGMIKRGIAAFEKFMNAVAATDYGSDRIKTAAAELKPVLAELGKRERMVSISMQSAVENMGKALDMMDAMPEVFRQVKARVAPPPPELKPDRDRPSFVNRKELTEGIFAQWRKELSNIRPDTGRRGGY